MLHRVDAFQESRLPQKHCRRLRNWQVRRVFLGSPEEHRVNVSTFPEEVQVEETVCPPDVKQGLKRYHESLVRRKADAKARKLECCANLVS